MKQKLRGMKRQDIQLDFDLYRVEVPIRGLANASLSVLDLWPEGAKQTVMFVHGYAGSLESWEFQINYFARKDRVVAPDLRGHGQSDAPYTQYTMAELVADLETIVETLHLPPTFILVGHSFGGAICIEYAAAHPARLAKLVLIATAGEYPLPQSADLLLRVPNMLIRPFWKYRPRWNAELHVLKRMMANNLRTWRGWPLLRNLKVPCLIVTGERDSYFPRYVFDDVGKMVPHAELYDVGSAKHKVQLERHEAVNRAIERFIGNDPQSSWRQAVGTPYPLRDRPWIKSYSPETPPTVPIPGRPLTSFLESAAKWVPKRTATIFYGTELSYQELNQQVNRFAHVLHGLGIRPGERVMVVLPNMPQLVIAYYAILKIGGVVVLSNPDADAASVIHQVQQTDAQIIITLDSFGRLAKTVLDGSAVHHVVWASFQRAVAPHVYKQLVARWSMDADAAEDTVLAQAVGSSMAVLMHDAPTHAPQVNVTPANLAAIIFTSGTTEEPKGVALTHANLVANTVQIRHWIPDLVYGQEICLAAIPLVHSYGMTNAMNLPVALGATIVLLPVFEVDQVLEQVKTYKPTLFPGVPSMYATINQAPNVRSFGLASIKACLCGAAPLPVEVQEAFEKLTRGRLVEGYGLTEASPVTHANPLYGVRKPGSIGVPIPNTDAKIVDLLTGADLPAGEVGELVVRGPQVMQGYWGDDALTDTATVLKAGWLYTGDVAVCDGDGYFQIISRKRDAIMSGDYSVYPRDVEEVIYENNKVREVAVVGVGTAATGQHVKAFVVPRPGTNLTAAELLDLCRRRLAPYAVPWEVEFRQELPKSFIGKVLRRLLVEEPSAQTNGKPVPEREGDSL
ncbi:MAG: alpha/beta fold hydrolase [Herpetosiphonaceae bacterium]|nr:alpha/beta fold hydrolase [Herpetosiphonaceae bacterium]